MSVSHFEITRSSSILNSSSHNTISSNLEADDKFGISAWFNPLFQLLRSRPCCFITAFKSDCSDLQNQCLNKMLEREIRSSGLAYLKNTIELYRKSRKGRDIICGTADCYCVIDNLFSLDDFKKLSMFWCNKFDQDCMFFTRPERNTATNNIRPPYCYGHVVNAEGEQIEERIENPSLIDIGKFFTNILGKKAIPKSVVINETNGHDIYSYSGGVLAILDFRKLYPELSVREGDRRPPNADKPEQNRSIERFYVIEGGVKRKTIRAHHFRSLENASRYLFGETGNNILTYKDSIFRVFSDLKTGIRVTFIIEKDGHRFFEVQDMRRRKNSSKWNKWGSPHIIEFFICEKPYMGDEISNIES